MKSEVVHVAKGDNGLPCETVDDAFARHYAGVAADQPPPVGYGAQGGHAQGVQYPENLPSPFLGSG